MSRFCALALVLPLVLALFASPRPALADKPITVGDGTAASCTEMALKHALLIAETIGGATIRFTCGAAPVTIALSQVIDVAGMLVLLVLPDHTTIDGGGLITLDGTQTATVVFVDNGTKAVLKGLTIINGVDNPFGGLAGGIVNNGTLTISKSTVSANSSYFAGSIHNGGTLTVDKSTISNSHGFLFAGGIRNLGTLIVRQTTFTGTSTAYDGGAITNESRATVVHSTFSTNTAFDGRGGAIINWGTLKVWHTTFAENVSNAGGGIINWGTLTVEHSTFSTNTSHAGGAIYNLGTLKVSDTEFDGNFAFSGAGLFVAPDASALVAYSRFTENIGFEGGGISNFGTLTILRSRLSGNVAHAGGGGGIFNGGTLALNHSVVTHNAAAAGGGVYVCVEGQTSFETGFPCHGTLKVKHTSITENTPDDIFRSADLERAH